MNDNDMTTQQGPFDEDGERGRGRRGRRGRRGGGFGPDMDGPHGGPGFPGRGPGGPRFGGPGAGAPGFGGPGMGTFGPGMGGFGPDMGHGRGRGARRGPGRGRRGDVRAAILALLVEQPMNGYQMITAISEKSEGLWSPGPGSIYPALGLLEDEGLIEKVEDSGKKVYRLTESGRTHVEDHADQLTAPWERVAEPHRGLLDVRPDLAQLGMAVQQVVMTGDAAQVEAARAILERARKDIFRLLAGDEPQA